MIYLIALVCVVGISIGQLLFKVSARGFEQSGSYFDIRSLSILFIALFLYGFTTLAWVWVLQKIELGKVYPLMALAFILVPIGSYFAFGERFNLNYVLGVGLIAMGIFMTTRS